MDVWPRMNHLERAIVRAVLMLIAVPAALVGAAFGWVGHQLFQHLHTESRSDHFRG